MLQGVAATPQTWKWNSASLYSIFPYFGDDLPQPKKKTKQVGGLCKAKASEVGAFARRIRPSVQCTSSKKILSLPGQSTLYIPRLNRENFGVTAFRQFMPLDK